MNKPPGPSRLLLVLLCCLAYGVAGAQTRDVSLLPETGRQRLTPGQWREDLQFAVDTFLARDRSFTPKARQQFRNAIAELQKNLDRKNDDQIIVEFAKAVALAKNAQLLDP